MFLEEEFHEKEFSRGNFAGTVFGLCFSDCLAASPAFGSEFSDRRYTAHVYVLRGL